MLADPFNFNIPNLADYISVLPISFYVGALYELVKSPNNETLKYFLGITASTIASDVIKRLPYPESLYKMSRRPDGAENCDYLSKMGPVKKDAPGFPSGHMTTTAFFAVYKVMENIREIAQAVKDHLISLAIEDNLPLDMIMIPLSSWSSFFTSPSPI